MRYMLVIFFGMMVACTDDPPNKAEPNNNTNNIQDMGPDAQNDSGTTDMAPDATEDVDIDVPPDMGDDAEADADEDMSEVIPGEIELVRAGERRSVILKGTILLTTGPIEGEVLIKDGAIACVAAECSSRADASDATILDTKGIISPGLIDAHNHLPYNFLKPWTAEGRIFDNRYQWADDPSYENHVLPYAANRSRGTHFCPGARWGEFRSLLHGTTTVMGQSLNQNCTKGNVRNADHEHNLDYNHMRTSISSPRDFTDAQADNYMTSFTLLVNPTTRFAVHMAEGLTGNNIGLEFSSFAGRDTRANRHAGLSLLYNGTSILIHSLGVTAEELLEVRDTNSKIVWSPSSNLVLYGQTIDIKRVLELGITTGIGPDWTVSGEPDMLAELRYALNYARQVGVDEVVTPKKLWEMATSEGALVIGLEAHIGSLTVGKRADITVFRKHMADPYESVVTARATDVQMVFVDGNAYYGPADLGTIFHRNEHCEAFDTCGQQRFMCVVDDPSVLHVEKVAQTRTTLVNILEGTGYPATEQYGRGGELLELVRCP